MREREAVALVELQDDMRKWWLTDIGKSMGNTLAKAWGVPIDEFGIYESMSLRLAQTYWVNADMADLAGHAAKTMPPQSFVRGDLPCPAGFALFQEPIQFLDCNGKMVNVRAVVWRPFFFADVGQARMEYAKNSEAALEQSSGVYLTTYMDPHGTDDYSEEASFKRLAHLLAPLHPLGRIIIPFGTKQCFEEGHFASAGSPPEKRQEITDSGLALYRLMPAIWTLMQQRLARTTETEQARQSRRRLERTDSPLKERKVRVITLRQFHRRVDQGGAAPEHTHRWIVSGHWRNQWLPSKNMHRLQWISAFVKGPEDKPLVFKPTVHQLVR
jgi:hypothetical protein